MIVSVLAAALMAPLAAQADDAIIGGDRTSDFLAVGQLAGIHDRYGLYPFCSGTLVRDTWVVTAAHCIDGADEIIDYGFELVFIVGENVISTSGIEDYAYIERMIDHPSYRGYDHDVGVVELSGAGLPDVPKIPLNEDRVERDWRNTDITYVGWGIDDDRGSGSGVKRTVDVPIYDYDSTIIYTWDRSGGANICSGDSGGAALREDSETGELELVAVNSFGFMMDGSRDVVCDDPYSAAGVGRIDVDLDWILDYVGPAEVEEEPEESEDDTGSGDSTDEVADGGDEGDEGDEGDGEGDELSGESAGNGKASGCSVAGGAAGAVALGIGMLGVVARRRDD